MWSEYIVVCKKTTSNYLVCLSRSFLVVRFCSSVIVIVGFLLIAWKEEEDGQSHKEVCLVAASP